MASGRKKSMLFVVIFVTAALFLLRTQMPASAGGDKKAPSSNTSFNDTTMNGFTLDQFHGFWNKWHYVTTRYRRDTGEMRFIYANNIAWRALLEKKTDYPDGAIFGKIGLGTSQDIAFTSSDVPINIQRYQFMVRDKKKFKDTGGWGYAIFRGDGHTIPEDPAIQSAACNACHVIVADSRGYIFGQPLGIDQLAASTRKNLVPPPPPVAASSSPLVFVTESVSSMKKERKELIPPSFKEVRLLTGPVQEHLFSGTLNEIMPALIKESRAQKMPAALISSDNSVYFVVFFDPKRLTCVTPEGKKGHAMLFSSRLPKGIPPPTITNGQSAGGESPTVKKLQMLTEATNEKFLEEHPEFHPISAYCDVDLDAQDGEGPSPKPAN